MMALSNRRVLAVTFGAGARVSADETRARPTGWRSTPDERAGIAAREGDA